MRKSARVDRYLRQLERDLSDMPGDSRHKIVNDVRDQIQKSLATGRSVSSTLKDMGSPKLIAMSHMKIRPPEEEKRSPWRKVAAIGTVVLFGAIFFFGLRWGLKHSRRSKTAAPVVDATPGAMTPGSRDLRDVQVDVIEIPFHTGKIELKSVAEPTLSWTCVGSPEVRIDQRKLLLDFNKLDVARCEIAVPEGVAVKLDGNSGNLSLHQPRGNLTVTLANGKVGISQDPARIYDFHVHVKNGLQDFFRPSANPRAIKVKIDVVNGTVKKE